MHVAPVRGQLRDVLAGDEDAALVGLLEPRDQAQRRGLARAGRAEQREEFAGVNGEVDAVDGADGSVGAGD